MRNNARSQQVLPQLHLPLFFILLVALRHRVFVKVNSKPRAMLKTRKFFTLMFSHCNSRLANLFEIHENHGRPWPSKCNKSKLLFKRIFDHLRRNLCRRAEDKQRSCGCSFCHMLTPNIHGGTSAIFVEHGFWDWQRFPRHVYDCQAYQTDHVSIELGLNDRCHPARHVHS